MSTQSWWWMFQSSQTPDTTKTGGLVLQEMCFLELKMRLIQELFYIFTWGWVWGWGVFLGGSVVKDPPANAGDWTVPALAREDPTCCGANKPGCHG